MRGGLNITGFTIVEALIFFAISGAILLSTLPFINDKTSNAQFETGIRQIQNNLQSTLNNVSTGNISSQNNYSCTSNASNPIAITLSGTQSSKGSNFNCTYVGEAIVFNANSIVSVPLAGIEFVDSNYTNPPTDLSSAKPCPLVSLVNSYCSSTVSDQTSTYNLPWGIRLVNYANSNPSNGSGMIGVYNIDSVNSSSVSSSLQIFDYGAGDTSFSDIVAKNSSVSKVSSLSLCFKSGTNNMYGLITIGNNNNPSSVNLSIGANACS